MYIHTSFLEIVCFITITNLGLDYYGFTSRFDLCYLMQLAAEYVKQNNLEKRGAQELAKAIKDHERRPQGREVCSEAIIF